MPFLAVKTGVGQLHHIRPNVPKLFLVTVFDKKCFMMHCCFASIHFIVMQRSASLSLTCS
jgi:hypothetical protein